VRWLGIGIAIVVAAGCTQAPTTNLGSPPGSNLVQAGWTQTSLDLDAVGFDCARATDNPAVLRATAGPGATHARALAQCSSRLRAASDDLQVYDRALVQARDLPLMDRERLHAFAGRLAALLTLALAAAGSDDMGNLAPLRAEIADVEGRMLAAGA
jgi:hypothetical protein